MTGYCGYSRSNNAVAAEQRGLLPLSRIGTGPWVRLAAELVGAAEWHHTSKFFNKTEYYDAARVRACARHLRAAKLDFAAVETLRLERCMRRSRPAGTLAALRATLLKAAEYRQVADRYADRAADAAVGHERDYWLDLAATYYDTAAAWRASVRRQVRERSA